MHLYQYNPHIFKTYIANDRSLELLHGYVLGGVAGYLAPKIRQQYKFLLFIGLGLCTVFFALSMYKIGWLKYHHWNHVWTFIRYFTPYIFIYWCDRWELRYLKALHDSKKR